MKHNYSNFSLTLLLSKYKMYVSRLQRHLDKGTFKGLSASRKNFLVRKVEELRARLQAMQFKVSGSIAAAGIATMLNVSTAEAQINFQENTAKNALALKHLNVAPNVRWTQVDAVDLNGDGKVDLVITDSDETFYYQNNGTDSAPSFTEITGSNSPFFSTYSTISYASYAFGDLDGDGDLDAVCGGSIQDNDVRLEYYRNDGSVSAANFVAVPATASPIAVLPSSIYIGYGSPSLVDLDEDGDLDIFLADGYYGMVHFLENTVVGTGTAHSWALNTSNNPFPTGDITPNGTRDYLFPEFMDIDADGDLDAVFGPENDPMFWYENTAVGTSTVMALRTGSENHFEAFARGWISPSFADFNADGKDDMVLGLPEGVTIVYNEGTSTMPEFTPAIPYVRFRTANLDGDGDQDLIFKNYNGYPELRTNIGSATAPNYVYVAQALSPVSVSAYNAGFDFADVDGDNDLDAVSNFNLGNFEYALNQGSASAPQLNIVTGTLDPFNGLSAANSADHVFVDVDGDGDQDLVQVDGGYYSSTFFYFKNESTGTTYDFTQITGTDNPFDGFGGIGDRAFIDFSDVDLDGDFDLLIGSANAEMSFYLNESTGTSIIFTLQTGTTSPFYGISMASEYPAPTFLDVDADGDEDLYIGNKNGTIRLYENNAIVSSIAPSKANTFSAEIIAFPNPAKEQLNFSLDDAKGANLTVVVLDMQGTAVSTTNVVNNGGAMSVDVSALNPGVYALRLNSDSKSATVKFVKQ